MSDNPWFDPHKGARRRRVPPVGAVFIAAWIAAIVTLPRPAQAETPVSIELVLAVDVSLSVDAVEYDLQMRGIADAFRRPEVVALIQQQSGVAVSLFQWSSTVDPKFVIPWHLLKSPDSIHAFADKVQAARRDPVRGFTAIGTAIEYGLRMLERNAYAGRKVKIDISGDGRNNTGLLPEEVWPRLGKVVVNGLPILIDTYNLDSYFREHVIQGPGAFIEIAKDYTDFAQAFLRKLKREIEPVVSERDEGPHRPVPVRLACRKMPKRCNQ